MKEKMLTNAFPEQNCKKYEAENALTADEKAKQDGGALACPGKNPVYAHQYKFFAQRSQLRVWVKKDKYERLKEAVDKNGTSIYRLINSFIDEYLEENVKEQTLR